MCDEHKPKHSFFHATSVLHGHHGVSFNPTSTDAEHVLGRYTRAVAREVYAPFFGGFRTQEGGALGGGALETSTVLARVTLTHCFAWVGIADELELSLR